MGFLDHLEELRWHLFRSVIAIAVAAIIIFIFDKYTLGAIIDYPFRGTFPSYRVLCKYIDPVFCFDHVEVKRVWSSPMEKVTTAFTFPMLGGLILAFPYIIWELWRFIKPALAPREARQVKWNVLIISMLFLAGISFGYFVILPFAIRFAETFDFGGDSMENLWRIGPTINFVLMIVLAAGLIFQIPVIMFYLAKLGMLKVALLRKYRRHSIVVLLVIAGLLTPPDPVSIFLLFFPLYFLFEIGVVITGRVEKKRLAKELAEEQAEKTQSAVS